LVLTGFAFDRQIGFGDAIFRRGLSPFRRTTQGLDDRCSRQNERRAQLQLSGLSDSGS